MLYEGRAAVGANPFGDLVDDPAARMGSTSDIDVRFKIESSCVGVKEKVMAMSSSCLDRCWRRASKFVSTPRSAIQRMLDYSAEVRANLITFVQAFET